MRIRHKSLARGAIRFAAGILGRTLPVPVRKALVASDICRTSRVGFELSMGLLADLRRRDPDALHRFLWSNHLAYAASYEIPKRFGPSNINPSRRILFSEIVTHLRSQGINPQADIRSIFEVGSSMGYLLRHLEVEVCPAAEVLHGLDIDEYAVETGMAYLGALESKVKLFAGDMAMAEQVMGNQFYDLILCCGVLMYVNEATAQEVVRAMFRHSTCLVGIICLADPDCHKAAPSRSITRSQDGAFIHDVDEMVRRAGGRVVSSRLVGTDISGSSSSYVILAEPPENPRHHPIA
jgi:hypothetical protein